MDKQFLFKDRAERPFAPPVIVTSRTSSGFDWGAGAIGAGGAVGLVAMLSAGAIAFRRRPALT